MIEAKVIKIFWVPLTFFINQSCMILRISFTKSKNPKTFIKKLKKLSFILKYYPINKSCCYTKLFSHNSFDVCLTHVCNSCADCETVKVNDFTVERDDIF
ncbi:hypothetical protein ACKWTF_011104 [Chironomus riparius]